jgi:hypothetical protein
MKHKILFFLIIIMFLGCTPRTDRSTGTVYRKEYKEANMLRMNKFHPLYTVYLESLSEDEKYSTRWSMKVDEKTYKMMKVGVEYNIK